MAPNQSPRHHKRSRANDAVEKPARPEHVKRRRYSESKDTPKSPVVKPSTAVQPSSSKQSQDLENREGWSFSSFSAGGRYSNLNPVMTQDEAYLFLGLEAYVQVFATSTSRLLRTLQIESGQQVIGYKLCPIDQEILYIFTNKFTTKWNWESGKQLASWENTVQMVAVDLPSVEHESQLASYSIGCAKDGQRQIFVNSLDEKKPTAIILLQTSTKINAIQVACEGRIIFACDGSRILLGTRKNANSNVAESHQYKWREATVPDTVSCFDLRERSTAQKAPHKSLEPLDLVLGEKNGSILIYQDIINTLFDRNAEKETPPMRMHWHRSAVNTVRWSHDGNYIISGGQESTLVLWQLDTGRQQHLPHLSSPICNIVVSPTGTSYLVKLTDNSVMVLSARELLPSANITGLQLGPNASAIALLHPQHPERLLVTVPTSFPPTQQSQKHQPRAAMLQTFDIRSNYHISRQALARTNTTTLNVGPDGASIQTPDVRSMDIAQDGNWLATIDAWTPNPKDVQALTRKNAALPSENILKFWKWSASSNIWELATRIDGPHSNHVSVLSLVARPFCHEFVTLGEDAILRFWCLTSKHRSGLKTDPKEQHQKTWKCRKFVDLAGCLGGEAPSPKFAALTFSEDGSVLAACLQSTSVNDGRVLLIDARNGSVKYRRTGVVFGRLRSAKFLGSSLIVASTGLVAVWDTVNDVVKPILLSKSSSEEATSLIAVNPRTQSFAVVFQSPCGAKGNLKFSLRVYDISTLEQVFEKSFNNSPIALLSDVYSGDFVIIDSSVSVQRLGCLDKASQKSQQSNEVTSRLNSGLASIFSLNQERTPAQLTEGQGSASQKGLASVFGETPSFSLPALSVLFRNVVQTLASS
ncbi:hypothetical protein N7495_007174 [Penicillium taxi]|uniref:uncharacterized protein n=1 Tax=Penicillium taxi TaxID=168475 RepID=UPI0025453829|nr:uncharacterized protein N7495_007174 [Penicillium taxi]KAJ5895483.1 hypothetical protein N7495_007174 [Penicillium taxi]